MKKNKLFDEIIAKIEKYDKISLFFHSHPDYDALCSCYALKLFIEAKYTKKQVYIARFNNLQAEITKNFFPKIKNKPANFLTQSLGIICDTANIERIAAPEFSKTKEYIKIDHHPNIEPYGSIIWVDDTASACCEMIANLLHYWDDKYFDKEIAKYLYAGILTDTNRFYYTSCTCSTMQTAGMLIDKKFDREEIYSVLYLNNLNDVKFNNYLFSKAVFIENNKIAYIIAEQEDFEKFNVTTKTPFVHVLSNISEVQIWFILYYEQDMKVWKGSLRSRNIVISDIAKKFNGGGHKFASGFKLEKITDVKKLISEIVKLIK